MRHVRLLRLAVRCPRCDAAPAIRISPTRRAIFLALPADAVVLDSYECRAHSCGERYPILAGHFARAGESVATGAAVA